MLLFYFVIPKSIAESHSTLMLSEVTCSILAAAKGQCGLLYIAGVLLLDPLLASKQ